MGGGGSGRRVNGGRGSQGPLLVTHSGMTTASLSSRFASSDPISSERSQSNPGADVGSGERSPGADVGSGEPSPVQMWAAVSAVPAQMCSMWAGLAQPRPVPRRLGRGIGMGGARIGGREKESRQADEHRRYEPTGRGCRAFFRGRQLGRIGGPGRDGTDGRCVALRYPLRRPSVSGKPPGFQYPYRNYQYPYRNYQHPYRKYQHPYRSSHETLIAILSTLIAMVQPRARRRDGRHRVAGVAPREKRANKHTSKQAKKQTHRPTSAQPRPPARGSPAPSGVASRQARSVRPAHVGVREVDVPRDLPQGTHGVLTGYVGVLTGYSRGTDGVRRGTRGRCLA
jgi:hypothetical protein